MKEELPSGKKSIYTICISIVVGFLVLGVFTYCGLTDSHSYQMITYGNSLVLFDKKTGDSWQKYLPPNEGPTEWEKSSTPTK